MRAKLLPICKDTKTATLLVSANCTLLSLVDLPPGSFTLDPRQHEYRRGESRGLVVLPQGKLMPICAWSCDADSFQRKSHRVDPPGVNSGRLPYTDWIPKGFRPHFVAMCGEFVGTWLFLFFALGGTQVANTTSMVGELTQTSATGSILYISLSFGFSLAVNAWVFFRISGGLCKLAFPSSGSTLTDGLVSQPGGKHPSLRTARLQASDTTQVTLGMCLVGALPPLRGVLLFIAQMLGAISSAAVVSVLFPGALAVGTTLNNSTTTAQGLFIEMFCTAELIFAIFMLAAEKHKATFIAPVGMYAPVHMVDGWC